MHELSPNAGHHFSGADYNHKRDSIRLTNQAEKIFALMKDGKPRSLAAISKAVGAGESSVSAQLRNFRKPEFGSHAVTRIPQGNGFNLYKLTVNRTPGQPKLF